MKKTITVDNQTISYTLKKSTRATHIRININSKGEITLTKPLFCLQGTAERFLKQKAKWVLKKSKQLKLLSNKKNFHSSDTYLKDKSAAKQYIEQTIEKYNKFYRYDFNRISIKRQKTKWGSCSSKKNLNFNYKILHLPPEIAEYIVVHELCHLKQLNHSKKFWALVEKTVPNHKSLRKELRTKYLLS